MLCAAAGPPDPVTRCRAGEPDPFLVSVTCEVELETNLREVWSCTITEKGPTRAFAWLKATAFTWLHKGGPSFPALALGGLLGRAGAELHHGAVHGAPALPRQPPEHRHQHPACLQRLQPPAGHQVGHQLGCALLHWTWKRTFAKFEDLQSVIIFASASQFPNFTSTSVD